MARSVGEREASPLDSTVPDLTGKIPTLEELMRRLPIPDPLKIFPPPAVPRDPFGPVPVIPPPVPTWPYGPPYMGGIPVPTTLPDVSFNQFASPREMVGGLLGMMQRSGAIGPSDQQASPVGGLVKLLQEYVPNDRERGD